MNRKIKIFKQITKNINGNDAFWAELANLGVEFINSYLELVNL